MLDVNMKESLSTKEIKRQEVSCPLSSRAGKGSWSLHWVHCLGGKRRNEHLWVVVSSSPPSFLSCWIYFGCRHGKRCRLLPQSESLGSYSPLFDPSEMPNAFHGGAQHCWNLSPSHTGCSAADPKSGGCAASCLSLKALDNWLQAK